MSRTLKRLLVLAAVLLALTAVFLPAPTIYVTRRVMETMPAMSMASRSLLNADGSTPMAEWLPVTDSSITLAEGGTLMRRLFPLNAASGRLDYLRPQSQEKLLWEEAQLDSSLFPDARANGNPRAAFDRSRVFTSVKRGLSIEERAYAGNIADDTVWAAVARAARAPGADIAAATFVTPIPEHLAIFELAIPRLTRGNAISDGIAYRAALHAAAGRRDSAEAVIAELYAVGMRLHLDGLNTMEGLIGNRVAMNALELRRGLHEVFPVAHSAAVIALVDSLRPRSRVSRAARSAQAPPDSAADRGFDGTIDDLIAAVGNPRAPRPRRFEALGLLGVSPCAGAGTMVFGPSDAVVQAMEAAAASLPRTDAERAYVAALASQSQTARHAMLSPDRRLQWFRSGNTVLSTITFNPRFRVCAEFATGLMAY